MNIDHLREFAYLAETLSFAATARHFFISASVLSKHVSALEDDLQVKLFVRDSRNVRITEDGEAFYHDIISVVDGFDRAVANLEARRYRDIDTFYFRIVQNDCAGFSSGHNYRQFEGRAVFLPLRDVDTTYTVSAQWLKSTDARVGALAREAAQVCAEFMKNWSDGVDGV